MNKAELGNLLDAFAEYYGAVPVSFVVERVTAFHPEIQPKHVMKAMKMFANSIEHHWDLLRMNSEEPMLLEEHLYALGIEDYELLMKASRTYTYYPASEEEILRMQTYPHMERTKALEKLEAFAQTELGLDSERTEELVFTCGMSLTDALVEGGSWLKHLLGYASADVIQFASLEQLATLREIGKSVYLEWPNQALKGWRPCDLPDAPPLPDDLPSQADFDSYLERWKEWEQIRKKVEALREQPWGDDDDWREELLREQKPARGNPGRNDPCPCGSGKKYKNCCGQR